MQVLVDLDTPGTVLDAVRAAAEAHIKAEASEFDGTLGVSFSASANPMKMSLSVYYEFSHNGGSLGGRVRAVCWRMSIATVTLLLMCACFAQSGVLCACYAGLVSVTGFYAGLNAHHL